MIPSRAAALLAAATLCLGCQTSSASLAPTGPAGQLAFRPARLCVTAGRVVQRDAGIVNVDVGGMRAIVAGDSGRAAEISFTYRGPSATTAPLANGEVRRQIGLKLRARDTCNVVYVMWHVSPHPGVAVSVKSNPGQSTHAACGAGGYETLRSTSETPAPEVQIGERHTLRAEIEDRVLRVTADGARVFEAPLPAHAFTLEGPAGVRSDNGQFDFELRVPRSRGDVPCPW